MQRLKVLLEDNSQNSSFNDNSIYVDDICAWITSHFILGKVIKIATSFLFAFLSTTDQLKGLSVALGISTICRQTN